MPSKVTRLHAADIRLRFTTLQAKLAEARVRDGSIDTRKLRSAVAEAGDPALTAALDKLLSLKNASSSRLSPSLVRSMDETLALAARGVEQFDANHDGVIVWFEKRKDAAVPQALTEEVIHVLAGPQKVDVHWVSAANFQQVDSFHVSLERTVRLEADQLLGKVIPKHVKTTRGQEAVRLAAQLEFVANHRSVAKLDKKLRKAESNVLGRLPLLHELVNERGHLSDAEVKRLLKTKDLGTFIARTSAKLEQALGGGTWAAYVEGADLPKTELMTSAAVRDLMTASPRRRPGPYDL